MLSQTNHVFVKQG